MSKKIILRQSVKSGVAVVFFFGLGMASINAQTTQTTQPTGKVGINTTAPTETLDVKGKVRIQELYIDGTQTGNKVNFSSTNVVTADDNGVLGKRTLSSIIAAQTPNFPWRKVGTIESAVPADGLSMYSKYKTGIGDYSSNGDTIGSVFEIKSTNATSDNGQQFGLINGPYKWHLSTENTTDKSGAFTLTKRNSNENGGQARVFSLTKDSKIYLGGALSDTSGGGAKIFIDGKDGKIGINKGSADYALDVNGQAKISTLNDQDPMTTNLKMVVADANGVLGKANIPSIPTEPWQVAGSTTQATANNQKIYQNNNVGIGDYSSTDIGSRFEINGGNSFQLGLINGSTKWDISTENKALTFTKRKPENGRIFSVTQEAKLYLGHNLLSESGNNAKVILDGENGKIGINKNSASYNLDVDGDAKISGLKSGTGYTAAHMVVADANGVLGKVDIPVIPTEPWNKLGGTTQATANTDNIYQKGKVGIGDYTSTSTFDSDFEVSSNRNGYQIGIANGDSKWNLSTESGEERAFSITKRHPNNQGRLLSLDKDAKLYLGNTLLNNSGGGAKILVDGGQGKIAIGHNNPTEALDVKGKAKIQTIDKQTTTTGLDMVVVGADGILKKADIPTGGGNGNGVTKHDSNSTPQCNAANAGTIHYKEEVTVNNKKTSVMGFCMKTATKQYRWFYIFGGAGTTTGSEAATPNFGDGL